MARTAKTARDLFVTSLRDIYDAEQQLLKALPKMAAAARSDALGETFENHRAETEGQVVRLEEVFKDIGEPARAKRCEAIRSLIGEAERHIGAFGGSPASDAALAAAGQAVEHYEMAHYTGLKRLAQQLGLTNAASKLDETLQEEVAAKDALDQFGTTGAWGTTARSAEATSNRNQAPRELRTAGVQPRVNEMDRNSNVRERDDRGRFMSDDDNRGSYRSRSQDYDNDRSYRSRSRDDDDYRSASRSRSRDDDDNRRQGRGGWFGDSEGHSEAARRGWEDRDDYRGRSYDDDNRRSSYGRSRDDDDYRSFRSRDDDNRSGRRTGGWFGDSEGHSEAARRGWESRDDDDRRYSSRGRDDDYRSSSRSRYGDDDRSYRSRSRDDDRNGRRSGGWFGDSEGHSEAAQKGWDRGREPGGWFGDSEGHSEASRLAWERGREAGGWFGDSEGHSEASRRGWENRDDDRRSSRRSYRD
ncbi:MAG: DUF892 family protein [Bauldia sp.]